MHIDIRIPFEMRAGTFYGYAARVTLICRSRVSALNVAQTEMITANGNDDYISYMKNKTFAITNGWQWSM